MWNSPTGKPITLTGFDYFRVAEGKIAEMWQEADQLGMLRQLGVVPGSQAPSQFEASRRVDVGEGRLMAYIDPVHVSPENYRIVLENDHVRVLHMDLSPGEKDQMHSHPSETVYFARGGKVRIHLPGGETVEIELPDGHVMWHEAWTHQVENVGGSPIQAIIVESRG